MLEHIRAQAGDGWYKIASRLAPNVTQAQRNTFAELLARTNGRKLADPLFDKQALHYYTEDIPQPVVFPPPVIPPTSTITHGRQLTRAMVGPRIAATTGYNDRQVISTPGTYTAVEYRGGVDVRAANVKFVDCRFSATTNTVSAVVHTNQPDTVFDHCEVDGKSLIYVAIKAENGSARTIVERCYIHHAGHGFNASEVSWRITESWIDDIIFREDWHCDGIIAWGSNTVCERSVVKVPLNQTAVINHGTWSGSKAPISNIKYTDNVFAGGGFAVYFEERGFAVTGLVVTNNDFDTVYYPRCGYYGPIYTGARPTQTPTWSGNKFTPSNTSINW